MILLIAFWWPNYGKSAFYNRKIGPPMGLVRTMPPGVQPCSRRRRSSGTQAAQAQKHSSSQKARSYASLILAYSCYEKPGLLWVINMFQVTWSTFDGNPLLQIVSTWKQQTEIKRIERNFIIHCHEANNSVRYDTVPTMPHQTIQCKIELHSEHDVKLRLDNTCFISHHIITTKIYKTSKSWIHINPHTS